MRANATSWSRDDAAVARHAWQFDSIGGFIAYGALWLFVAAAVPLVVTVAMLHASAPVFWTGFALMWLPFAAWVRARRSRVRGLFRDGDAADGVVVSVDVGTVNRVPTTWIGVAFRSRGHEAVAVFAVHPPRDVPARVPIMFAPDLRFCAALVGGRAVPGRWYEPA